jgi:hypothetical protein
MAVRRQQSVLAQQRVDVPVFRAIESSVAADFDLLAGTIMANRIPAIVSGFNLITSGVTQPSALQIQVANSVLMHYYATDSGTIFQVDADRANETLSTTNPKIQGSFLPGQTNYIGLDFSRASDPTTTDAVQFFDTDTNAEVTKTVPLARTIDYTIIISASDFDSNSGVCPLAKVTLDSNSVITSVQDARNILWRLGTGGSTPNTKNAYSWPAGRNEASSSDPFLGGDKAIGSMKSWMDAMMTRAWEMGGGEFWYSPTADRNVVMGRTGSPFVSSGEYFEWSGSNLHWQGLTVTFANSTGIYNDISNQTGDSVGLTNLADGECIYVDLDRTQTRIRGTNSLNAVKASLSLLGTPDVPGSRWVIAWRYGSSIFTRDQSYAVGSAFKLATVSTAGMVRLSATDTGGATPPRVASVDSTSFVAYAGGLTRGNDFFGGAGDIAIGGAGNDHNILLTLTRNQDEVVVQATKSWATTPESAPFTVQNLSPFTGSMGADGRAMAARFRGWNDGTAALETNFVVYANGVLGFRSTTQNVPGIASTSTFPIDALLHFGTNGLGTPNARQTLLVTWSDGTTETLAEGPPS